MGFAYFAAVKAVGYTATSAYLKRRYGLRGSPRPNILGVGLTRTGIGLRAGALYGGLWLLVLNKLISGDTTPILYYIFLLPIRLAEWCFLIWLFFDRALRNRTLMWESVGFGTVCSYALDIFGVGAALVLPGGMWIC